MGAYSSDQPTSGIESSGISGDNMTKKKKKGLSENEKMILAGIGIAGAVGGYYALTVLKKKGDWTEEYRCEGTTRQRKFVYENGTEKWIDIELNSIECGYVPDEDEIPPEEPEHNITIFVKDSRTYIALDADVYVADYTKTTDEYGRIEIMLPKGSYVVSCSSVGYISKSVTKEITGDTTFTVYLDQEAHWTEQYRCDGSNLLRYWEFSDGTGEWRLFEANSTQCQGEINGFVKAFPEGTPIKDATVSCQGKHVATDINGYYKISSLFVGTTVVTASAFGRESSNQTVLIEPNETKIVNFYLAKTGAPSPI